MSLCIYNHIYVAVYAICKYMLDILFVVGVRHAEHKPGHLVTDTLNSSNAKRHHFLESASLFYNKCYCVSIVEVFPVIEKTLDYTQTAKTFKRAVCILS